MNEATGELVVREVVVEDPGGMHLRVAARVVQVVQAHDCQVKVRCADCREANACSIFELLTLAAPKGTPLTLRVSGPQADAVADCLVDVFGDGGGI